MIRKLRLSLFAALLCAAMPAFAAPTTVGGRVLDENGAGASGAWVTALEALALAPVRADENGAFELRDVPLDSFTLLAARGKSWAKQSVKGEQNGLALQLENAPVADAGAEKARALEQLTAIQSALPSGKVFGSWDALGTEWMEKFLWRKGEPSPQVTELFHAELARRDPAQLLRRAPELLDTSSGDAREDLQAQIYLLSAVSTDADARAEAGAWLDEEKSVKRAIAPRSVTRLLQMAAVARKLERQDSAQWVEYAAAVAAQLGAAWSSQTRAWAAPLAALGFEVAQGLVEGHSVTDEFRLWADLAPALARAGDIKGARAAFTRLETLARDPEIIERGKTNTWENLDVSPQRLFAVRRSLVRAIAPVDAATALELANQTGGDAQALLLVADGARKLGGAADLAIGETALRTLMKQRVGNVEYYALGASIGAQISPQLGVELFDLTNRYALTDAKARMGFAASSTPSIGPWAFYHARFDPALSRVLIEREWNWRLPATRKVKKELFSSYFVSLHQLIRGMASVDGARAAEMRSELGRIELGDKDTREYLSEVLQFDIAVAALASDEERARLGTNDLN